jgi:lipopolysaccharide/colanic/teichoic acid biosynthesis glycosyltransferase
VFFPQTRVGYLGREFRFWKFRTMHVNNDTESHRQYMTALIGTKRNEAKPMEKTEEVSRIIPFGRFIRKSCVDELPQLYNVLIGDMSLIGPRPAIPYEVDAYQRWHSSRFDTIPGMTGLWQVSGKNRLSFQEMVSLDIRYLRDLSLRQDARILARTIPAILDQIRAKTRKGK